MKGIYSDAFTTELRLPDGFGLHYTPDDDLQWMPMFNNRGKQPVRVAMKVELTLVRAKDLKKPLRPLYSTLRSVQVPHLFFVEPGRDERQVTFEMPMDGRNPCLGDAHPSVRPLDRTLQRLAQRDGLEGDAQQRCRRRQHGCVFQRRRLSCAGWRGL